MQNKKSINGMTLSQRIYSIKYSYSLRSRQLATYLTSPMAQPKGQAEMRL